VRTRFVRLEFFNLDSTVFGDVVVIDPYLSTHSQARARRSNPGAFLAGIEVETSTVSRLLPLRLRAFAASHQLTVEAHSTTNIMAALPATSIGIDAVKDFLGNELFLSAVGVLLGDSLGDISVDGDVVRCECASSQLSRRSRTKYKVSATLGQTMGGSSAVFSMKCSCDFVNKKKSERCKHGGGMLLKHLCYLPTQEEITACEQKEGSKQVRTASKTRDRRAASNQKDGSLWVPQADDDHEVAANAFTFRTDLPSLTNYTFTMPLNEFQENVFSFAEWEWADVIKNNKKGTCSDYLRTAMRRCPAHPGCMYPSFTQAKKSM
jgi:hypothetical protein